MKQLFEDEAPEKRAELLAANAVNTEPGLVKRIYTAEQIKQMKDSLAEVSVYQAQKIAEFNEFKKKWQVDLNGIEVQRKEVLIGLRDKFYEKEELLYLLENQEDGVMEYYDAEGILVHSRRLLPGEKKVQLTAIRESNG